MISTFFRGMTRGDVTQVFHSGHQALDIDGNNTYFGYGTPLCAPEDILILGIRGEGFTPGDHANLEYGYGISFKGLETGIEYLYWHCLPYFPVWGGQRVKRGGIIAYMGNAGLVYKSGAYVPVNERTDEPFKGTHVHIQAEKDGQRVDLLPLINFDWQPEYTRTEYISAFMAVLKKMSQGVK